MWLTDPRAVRYTVGPAQPALNLAKRGLLFGVQAAEGRSPAYQPNIEIGGRAPLCKAAQVQGSVRFGNDPPMPTYNVGVVELYLTYSIKFEWKVSAPSRVALITLFCSFVNDITSPLVIGSRVKCVVKIILL